MFSFFSISRVKTLWLFNEPEYLSSYVTQEFNTIKIC
jgi:hypothetical protein